MDVGQIVKSISNHVSHFLFLKRWPCSAFRSFHPAISGSHVTPSDFLPIRAGSTQGRMQGHVPSGSVTPAKLPWSEVKLVRQCQVRQVSSCTLRDVEDSILLAFVSQASIEGAIFAHGNLLMDDLYTHSICFPLRMCFPAISARTSTQICMAIATLIAFLDFTANSSRDVISCHGCHSWSLGLCHTHLPASIGSEYLFVWLGT